MPILRSIAPRCSVHLGQLGQHPRRGAGRAGRAGPARCRHPGGTSSAYARTVADRHAGAAQPVDQGDPAQVALGVAAVPGAARPTRSRASARRARSSAGCRGSGRSRSAASAMVRAHASVSPLECTPGQDERSSAGRSNCSPRTGRRRTPPRRRPRPAADRGRRTPRRRPAARSRARRPGSRSHQARVLARDAVEDGEAGGGRGQRGVDHPHAVVVGEPGRQVAGGLGCARNEPIRQATASMP